MSSLRLCKAFYFSNALNSYMQTGRKPISTVSGVPVFSIGGRMVKERERLLGMTEEERRWRAQYLKDQMLKPGEPRFSPEYYKATTNIFRRMIRFPMQLLQNALTPVVGEKKAAAIRFVAGRSFLFLMSTYYITYYFMYNRQDWTTESGWHGFHVKRECLPGDPDYPNVRVPKKHEYFDQGFSKSIFFKE